LLADAVAWRATAAGPVVFTNGVFDLLHSGHVTLLEHARAFGGSLIVALNSDASVRTLGKGPHRPLVSERDRARLVAALGCVDCVVLFEPSTPIEVIEALTPDILVKGADYRAETVVGADVVRRRGGRIEIVPLVPEQSTTRIAERLRASS
jgi:D-beta-D-heptose 7-phosphate kinase/D-beta-D-heptose 1-phosphate adenosyltransferase